MSINWGKKKRVYINNNEEENENSNKTKKVKHDTQKLELDDEELGNLLNLAMPKNEELIYKDGNHIYYWDEINTENVLKFTKLLRKVDYLQQCSYIKGDISEPKIYIHINSPGGSLLEGFSMASYIKGCKSKTIGIIEGCVASAATLPLVVCNHRQMQQYSYLLIHQLRTSFWGTFSNLLDETETCKDMMRMLTSIYLDNTKVPKNLLQSILKRELMWNSSTCYKYNIIDEII